jgi:hypothetical protein
MREDDKGDGIGNPFLLLSQGNTCKEICNISLVEYKPGVEEARECHMTHLFSI